MLIVQVICTVYWLGGSIVTIHSQIITGFQNHSARSTVKKWEQNSLKNPQALQAVLQSPDNDKP